MAMQAGKKIFFKKFWKWTKRSLLFMFISSLIYIIVCRWVMPPTTIIQIQNSFNYTLKKNYVKWDEISYNIKLAALASEDQNFPDHGGFDWGEIKKSFEEKKGKKKKRPKGAAASTITQQTAKNVFLFGGSGVMRFARKVPEAYFTKMIEWTWGKKRILEVYLNVIEMGPGIFGVEAASQTYFHKHAKNLSREEAAIIIACLPNPKRFTVVPKSVRVNWRTPQILQQMRFIEDDEDVQAVIK